MRDDRTDVGGWVRGLFRRGDERDAKYPGEAKPTEARRAVETTEALICASICRAGDPAADPTPGVNVFGKPVERLTVHDAASAVATAAGLTMSGRRAAAFLGSDDLTAACAGIRSAVRRCLPLVAHVTVDSRHDHAACHALADTGAFVLFASDAQEAIDLTLVARRVAEHALVPGVVVFDGAEAELELREPDTHLIQSFVGDPGETMASPTPAQVLVFGDRRRRLPRWYDPARPIAHGVTPSGEIGAATAASRRVFFAHHLRSIASESVDELARLTGRPCDRIRRHRVDDARFVVVAQGTTVERAETVADRIRASRAGKVGVLGVSWLQPFPAEQLREALSGARVVTVLERCDDPLDAPPLLREVRSALGASAPRLLSATHADATDDQLEAVFRNMQAGEAVRPSLHLGVASPSTASPYPKREALLQRLLRDYPDLRSVTADRPERAQRVEGPTAEPPSTSEQSGGAQPADADPPFAVHRFAYLDSAYDNVARFWGEFAQPYAGNGDTLACPDPYLAIEALPACTATFHEVRSTRDELPRIDPDACTGCGRCWTLCPHSAVAPLAIGMPALMEALAEPDISDDAAAKLHRVLPQLGRRVNGLLSKSGASTVCADLLDEAFDWLAEQMKVSEEDRPGLERAFRAIAERVVELPLSVTAPFFGDVEQETRGSGELLMLAVEPRSCSGCGVCASVCPDRALQMEPRSDESVAAAQALHRRWERLPDTPGPTIARAGKDDRVGALASILMSRHCSLSLPGGDAAEPGSGERLAVRQLAAVVEFEMQRRMVAHVEALDKLQHRLREKIREAMAGAVEVEDLGHLDTALRDVPQRAVDVGQVLEQIRETGERTDLDVEHVHRLVRAAMEIERLRHEITEGRHGAGRARFGVVIAGSSVADWAVRFPRNPFGVPLAVGLGGEGADVASGLARGLLAERTEDARLIRMAELLLEAPSDLPAKERELRELSPRDLTPEERALCLPLIVICGADAFGAADVAAVSRLLASGLPIKLVLLDGRDVTLPLIDASSLALAQQRAFVLAASVAEPNHLHSGMTGALDWPGAALIHVHAPSPSQHGYDPRETVERARLAVATRVHPLLRFEPGRTAPILDGNPAPDRTWAGDVEDDEWTPAAWAIGESRFERHFAPVERYPGAPIIEWLSKSPDERGAYKPTVPGPNGGRLAVGDFLVATVVERRDAWTRLQEAAGWSGPAAEAARARAAAELREEHDREMQAMRAEYEQKLEEIEKRQLASQAARLRARVLQLAGFGSRGAERRRDS
jgi:pyruvate/2-oxoacid:ferredoxin oxidoreductase alpha subunit/ferredoxin